MHVFSFRRRGRSLLSPHLAAGAPFSKWRWAEKSSCCNNFGSYGWFKRRGERVDFMLGFPNRTYTSRPHARRSFSDQMGCLLAMTDEHDTAEDYREAS